MIDRSQIKRGVYLKGGEFPGAVVQKNLSLEERKIDVEGRLASALKERSGALARELEITRLRLATRKWRRLHSL
jgi:hypothetical protein